MRPVFARIAPHDGERRCENLVEPIALSRTHPTPSGCHQPGHQALQHHPHGQLVVGSKAHQTSQQLLRIGKPTRPAGQAGHVPRRLTTRQRHQLRQRRELHAEVPGPCPPHG